ncbi:MAG: hypothetical protein JWQ01_4866 [Massilia sp.]|nr:hypothetical protein [Massilia sp.]
MKIHLLVAEIYSIAKDPSDTRIIAHAQFWSECEEAFAILRANGHSQSGGTIVDAVRAALECGK